MRSLNIIARFPLGVYVGHKSDRRSDEFPDPARLHAALLNSAAQGTQAIQGKHLTTSLYRATTLYAP